MSLRAGFLQNFGGMIALGIAGGVLAAAFEIAKVMSPAKETEPPKPVCVQTKDPVSGLNIYNPDCK